MTRQTILAVGAAGRFAGLAVTALSQRGVRVRGFVRNAEQGNNAQRLGATEVVIGDLLNLQSVEAALAGVDAVFYRAAFASIDQTEPLTRARIRQPVIAIGGVKGLRAKVGAMVKRIAC